MTIAKLSLFALVIPFAVGCDAQEPESPPTGRDALVEICLDTCADDDDCQRCESDELGFTLDAETAADFFPELELPAVSELEGPTSYGAAVEPTTTNASFQQGVACAVSSTYCDYPWYPVLACNWEVSHYGVAEHVTGTLSVVLCADYDI